jgi:hypothetical protein
VGTGVKAPEEPTFLGLRFILRLIHVTITVGIEAERAFHTSVNRWNPLA